MKTVVKKFFNRIKITMMIILSLFLSFLTIASTFHPAFVSAEVGSDISDFGEMPNSYDDTFVENDLGVDVLKTYANKKVSDSSQTQIYTFMEYCFAENENIVNTRYSLYLYVYNPFRRSYCTSGIETGYIRIATSYDETGEPVNYSKFELKFCGKTSGTYENLFYKYRVLNVEQVLNVASAYQETYGYRRYDFTEMLLGYGKDGVFTDLVDCSRTYKVSGYGKGLSEESKDKSTLSLSWDGLTTLNLDVGQASYISGSYNWATNTCDLISTLYFGLDKEYIDKYGGLQKIKAEWYEYKTNYIYQTSNRDAYNALYQYVGMDVSKLSNPAEEMPYTVFFDVHNVYDSSVSNVFDTAIGDAYNHWNEAWDTYDSTYIHAFDDSPETVMDWLFFCDDATFSLTREQKMGWMTTYTNRFPDDERIKGFTEYNNGYSINLFADSIDADRIKNLENPEDKRGYVCLDIDVGNTQNLLEYKDPSIWDIIFGFEESVEKTPYDPIVLLDKDDLSHYSTDLDVASSMFAIDYYIGSQDAKTVYTAVKNIVNAGQYAVLFRFANTDYYCSTACFDDMSDYSALFPNYDGGYSYHPLLIKNGYVSQETMFFGLDVIQLTFRNKGVDTVIPVVAESIDAISNTDADKMPDKGVNYQYDDDSLESWEILLIVLAVVLVLILLVFIFKNLKGNGKVVIHNSYPKASASSKSKKKKR